MPAVRHRSSSTGLFLADFMLHLDNFYKHLKFFHTTFQFSASMWHMFTQRRVSHQQEVHMLIHLFTQKRFLSNNSIYLLPFDCVKPSA